MTAQKKPSDTGSSRETLSGNDLVSKFELEYGDILVQAAKAAETTSTEGWSSMYSGQMERDRKARERFSSELRGYAEDIRDPGMVLLVDDLKPMNDTKKDITEHIKGMAVWKEKTVSPFSEIAMQSGNCKSKYARLAREQKDRTPLLDSDGERSVVDRMDAAIKAAPTVKWDKEKGKILVEQAS